MKSLRYLIYQFLLFLRKQKAARTMILRFLVWTHNTSYHLISLLASFEGLHPKHAIMKYHRFFLDNIHEKDAVIDVGSGNGKIAWEISKKAQHVTGIDIRRNNVQNAKLKYQRTNLSFVEGDATKHSFNKTYDVIVLSNVLEHIDDRIVFLRKLTGIAPRLLIRVPMLTRDWVTVFKKNEGFEYRLDDTHTIEYDEQVLRDELGASGWKVETMDKNYGEFYVTCRT